MWQEGNYWVTEKDSTAARFLGKWTKPSSGTMLSKEYVCRCFIEHGDYILILRLALSNELIQKEKKSSKHINLHSPPTLALPLVPHLDLFHLCPLYSSVSWPSVFFFLSPHFLFSPSVCPMQSASVQAVGSEPDRLPAAWPAARAFLWSKTASHLLSLAIYSVHIYCEAARVTRSSLPCYFSPLLKPFSLFAHL